jgi:hypothetical protein
MTLLLPTLALAGAETCKLEPVVTLGPVASGRVALGFGAGGGLAAWKPTETTLAVRHLASNGSPRGAALRLAIDPRLEPRQVHAVAAGYVVLLSVWDWRAGDARWLGVFASAHGQVLKPPVDLGLDGMDIVVGRAIDDERVALIVTPAAIAPNRAHLRGRWQTVRAGADGRLASTATEVDVTDLAPTTQDRWAPATLGADPGWAVERDHLRRPLGVFGGRLGPAAGAVLLDGGFTARVLNLAEPPPQSADGTIFEVLPAPALVREHRGKPVGRSTLLEVGSSPVGVHGLSFTPDIAWSGTHFVYPFATSNPPRAASLLPIDCRP